MFVMFCVERPVKPSPPQIPHKRLTIPYPFTPQEEYTMAIAQYYSKLAVYNDAVAKYNQAFDAWARGM